MKRMMAAFAVSALALTGCSSQDEGSDQGSQESVNTDPIRMSVVHGWELGIISTTLWKIILEEKGYNVDIVEISDIGPSFLALAEQDLDLITESWLPYTNARQIEEYGDQVVDLGGMV